MNNIRLKIIILIGIILFTLCLIISNLLAEPKSRQINNQTFNIAFCIDNNYKKILPVVICSIHANNPSATKYHFYIFSNTLSFKERVFMWFFIKRLGYNANIIKIDTTPIDNGQNLYQNSKYTPHITRIGTGRLVMVNYLPKNLSRILYLDADILVMKDISDLFHMDLGNNIVAMAIDDFPQIKYYNSGVILIDLKKWKENNIQEKIYTNASSKDIEIIDQDILNKALHNKIKELPVKYNYYRRAEDKNTKLEDSQIYIKHFLGASNPKLEGPIADEYASIFETLLKQDILLKMFFKYL